jgi:hypothetical protein
MEAKITCNNVICYTEKLQFENRIRELEEGIEKHKSTLYTMGCLVIASLVEDRDKELHKLVKKK